MFPAAESAFIITAPEATLAPSPSLFLVAAALNSESSGGERYCFHSSVFLKHERKHLQRTVTTSTQHPCVIPAHV